MARKLFFIILSIFLSGLLIRLYEISSIPPGLYTDELQYLLSAYVQMHGVGTIPFSGFSSHGITGYVYYSLNGYFISLFLFGLGNLSARFPVALFSAAMVVPIYLVSKEYLKDENVGILAAILWEFSPASFVMARWGDGVEFFPLFLFLFILYFAGRLVHHRNARSSFVIVIILSFLSIYLPSVAVWTLIPLCIFFVSLVGYFLIIKSRKSDYWNRILYLYIVLLIAAVDIFVSFPNLIFDGPLKYLATAQVNRQYYLFYLPYYISFPQFFIRLFTFISPTKLFIFPGVTSQSVGIQQVLIPFALWYLLIPFYATFFYIVFKTFRKKLSLGYPLMIILFLAGFIQPILNISNPNTSLEPAEAMFADPFLMIISSFGIIILVRIFMNSTDFLKKHGFQHSYTLKFKISSRYKKKLFRLSALAFCLLLVSSFVTTTIFFSNYFTGYGKLQETNESSIFYMTYGLEEAGNFIITHNMTNDEIFFVPSGGGGVNFSNSGVFNYWVYNLNFPSAWFYVYTHQEVRSVNVLRPGTLPNPHHNNTIVISQDAAYGSLLTANGFSYRLLYTFNRSNGLAAVSIYQILPITTPTSTNDLVYDINNFTGPLNTNVTFPINHSFTAILEVSTVGSPHAADLLYSHGYGLDIGVNPANFYPWLGLPNDTLVPFSNLYSRIQSGNYTTPYSWYQFAAHSVLRKGSKFMISVIYDNGTYSTYINDTRIGKTTIKYPVVIQNIIADIPKSYVVDVLLFNNTLAQGNLYDIWFTLAYEHFN
jgi:hypothetical protein